MEQRLQKILSELGLASRRKTEEMIEEGRIIVNGQPATLGMKADPEVDYIKLDGKLIKKTGPGPKVYYAMHKPVGVVTTLSDPEERPTVADFLKGVRHRVYPVGRLDFDSEGLIILTNDGEFANQVLHPSQKVPKTYLVKVKGEIGGDAIMSLRKGIKLKDGLTAPARVKRAKGGRTNSWLEVIIHEGKKRQIRRMVEKVGHPAIRLRRVAIGPIRLGALKVGAIRKLDYEEISGLLKMGGKKDAQKGNREGQKGNKQGQRGTSGRSPRKKTPRKSPRKSPGKSMSGGLRK